MIGAWVLLGVGTVLAVLGMTAAVSATTVRRVELYRWVAQARPGAVAANMLLSAPGRLWRVAMGLVTLGLLIAALGLAPTLARLPLGAALGGAFLVALPVTLVLGYAVPRAVGERWPEGIVRRTARWLDRAAWVLAPLSLGASEPRTRLALEAGGAAAEPDDALERDELTVLAGVQAFTERPVREVMTPRTEIIAVREGASLEEVAQTFADSGYSRLPVYRESLDNIIGIIYAFDLLKIAPGAELPLRPVVMAPASKTCVDLVFELQHERRQFAVVLDEYGGTAGIATFEDLLEELVGEIFDEYDDLMAGEGAIDLMEVSGATPAAEVAARFSVALPGQAETIGGLLARAAGRIPRLGDRYHLAGLEFDILDASPTRVQRVLIRRGPIPVAHLERERAP